MPIETASMDKPLPARRIPSLELAVAMGIATLIAPAAAPASVLVVLLLIHGDFGGGLLAAALAPFALLTIPAMYGYAMAFVAVALLGTGLTLLTLRIPRLRPKRIWTAIGALSGTLIAAVLVPLEPALLLSGAAAGGSCAFLYRLIVASPLASVAGARSPRPAPRLRRAG